MNHWRVNSEAGYGLSLDRIDSQLLANEIHVVYKMTMRICPLCRESVEKAAAVLEGRKTAIDGQEVLNKFGMYLSWNACFPYNGDRLGRFR